VKFVLFALSVGWMDEDGGSCFPALVQIAGKAGLSRQAVARALDQAVEAGYLKRWHWGYGKGNRRWKSRVIPSSGRPGLGSGGRGRLPQTLALGLRQRQPPLELSHRRALAGKGHPG